ncbi:NAD-dependent epimerase/dehydratase family protein [Kribbella capetownensis]|uniref:NAD-dependent epimerase/dehydratase family protein n=1 Tax=Kribbella capetownensis TaxID=1572659 RepID=A0A4R0K4H8_9ACTN|nr:NAD-dependent epimerase/dehydratase family protein [Kribbella capetownensis]TCC53684.1 NAD-dependent epimerase/dehydratase family protein [Kribbella capetownensis]
MRTVVIGGTGHIGTYLVPELVRLGHQVTVLSRGERSPYQSDGAWKQVELVPVDRAAEDAAGTFGERVAGLEPDIVIDLICFTEDSAKQLVEAVRGKIQHLLHCGTIWVHGPSMTVPTREDTPRRPFGDYGIQKAAIERYLLDQSRRNGLPATIIHPGHICGPGWTPITPAATFNLEVYEKLAHGHDLLLPNLGLETINPVHADDVAGIFLAAIASRSTAIGESFHVVASDAVTLRGYAHAVADWFGQEARLSFLPIGQLREQLSERDAGAMWDHVAHSPNCSMDKAARLLGFRPRYSAIEAARSGIEWLVDNGKIT